MDSVTQSNAAVAEESASASEELSAQAENLNGIVEGLNTIIQGGNVASRVAQSQSYSPPKKTTVMTPARGLPAPKPKPTEKAAPVKQVTNHEELIPFDDDDFDDF